MEEELNDYILKNYRHFFNAEERRLSGTLHNYHNWLFFVKTHGEEEMRSRIELFDLTESDVAFMEGTTWAAIYTGIAEAVYDRHKSEIYLNLCPECGGLARTLVGRQCRKGHRW